MKQIFLLISLLISILNVQAQLSLQWAKKNGNTSIDRGISMTNDGNGNVITTGVFSGSVDFDPGTSSFTMTANANDNMYVCKLDGNGGFLWARQFLCNTSNAFSRSVDICSDAFGNIFITGWFNGTVDFDSGSASYTLAAAGSYNMFVCKFSANGNFQWVKRIGGGECVGNSIAVDASGNIFTTGFTYGNVDFDPGSGTYTFATVGGVDGFISKLDAGGNFVWATSIASTDNDFGNTVSLDPSGNVLVTGRFRSTVDFDPGPATYTLSSASANTDDVFICKLSNSGAFIWANRIGGVNADEGIFISTDAQGNIYNTGKYSSTVDLDPGPGTFTLVSSGLGTYILKLNPSGNFLWAKTVTGATSVEPHSIAIDAAKYIYITGSFSGLADFDPGPGSYSLSSAQASYILKLDSAGSFVWAKQADVSFFSTIERYGKSIAVDGNKNIYLSGYFSGSSDLDFTSATYSLSSAGAEDIFAAKYCQVPEPLTNIVGEVIACSGTSLNFSVSPANGATSYSWSLPAGLSGTGSTYSLNVIAGSSGGIVSVVAVNACGSSASRTIAVTITPSLNISVNNPIICSPGATTLIASGASSYTWNTGTNTNSMITSQSVTTTYTVIGSAAGCANDTKTATVSISPVSVTLTASSTTLCSGRTATLSAAGAPNYSWSTGATTSSLAVIGTTMSSGNFTVRGYNNGCSDSKTLTIMFYASPVIVGNSVTVCQGATFTMSPTGAATYTFSNGSATASPTSNTTYSITGTSTMGCISVSPGLYYASVAPLPTVSVNSGTICAGKVFTMNPSGANTYSFSSGSSTVNPMSNSSYSVTGTSLLGCTSINTAIASVSVFASPVISANSGSICAGNVFTINPTGAISYNISGGSNTVSPSPGIMNFTVTGTDVLGCESAMAISTVTVHALPTITVNSGSICIGETFTMIPTGAVSYTYSNNSSTAIPVSNTSYSVTGTSQEGCISLTAISNITVNPLPVITVNSGTICAGQIFSMSPSGANTYTFSSGSSTVTPIVNSTYFITGTNLQGCVSANAAIASASVIALPVVTVNSGSICSGQAFTINPIGASSYSYSSNSNIVSPPPGITNYSVTGTNLSGCESLFAISTVTTYALPIVTVNSGSICAGETFTMLPTGAVNYSFSSVSATVNPLSNTTYSVSGTGPQGCVSLNAISNVTVGNLPNITVSSSSPSICVGESATLTALGALSYTWSGGETANSITVAPSATLQYTVSGSDYNGCTNSYSLTQLVDLCLGIGSQRIQEFKIYPNPNAGELYIETETALEIDLINSLGEFSSRLNLAPGKNKLYLEDLANGIYFIKIKKDQSLFMLKVIKQ